MAALLSRSRRLINPKLPALLPRNPTPLPALLPRSDPLLSARNTKLFLPFPFPSNSTAQSYPPLSPNPFLHLAKPISIPLLPSRNYSSSPPEDASAPPQKPAGPDELRHQEIVGPTVERDESALANETRQVLDGMRKTVHDLSSALAVLGVAHLGLGAWIIFSAPPAEEAVLQGVAAFAFPFTLAFLMRGTLKPMAFFRKMEEQGRLQILTLALQVSKSVNLLLLRTRLVALCCVAGVSAGSLAITWLR